MARRDTLIIYIIVAFRARLRVGCRSKKCLSVPTPTITAAEPATAD
jgi:hypothetical protein